MKEYELLTVNCVDYKFLVLSTSYESPLKHLKDIVSQLSCQSDSCKVVFDLLLSMGNNSDRFVEATYDGLDREITSFNFIVLDKQNCLRKVTSKYYKEHICLTYDSVLTSQQKNLLSKGIPI